MTSWQASPKIGRSCCTCCRRVGRTKLASWGHCDVTGSPDAATLLRVLLIHLAQGGSLRETAVRAAEGQLVAASDVALPKRVRMSGELFRVEVAGAKELQLTRMEYDLIDRQYYSVDNYPLRDGLRAAIGEHG